MFLRTACGLLVVFLANYDVVAGSCCDRQVNLVALFDRSTSFLKRNGDVTNFNNAVTYLKDVFRRLTLGSDAVVTAAYTYSNSPNLEWDFDTPTSTSLTDILTAIDGFAEPSGQSNLDKALNRARIKFNSNSRVGGCNVVLVMTDGQSESQSDVLTKAEQLRAQTDAVSCVAEFIDPDENPSQQENRDVTLQYVKGDGGVIIGTDVFTASSAVANTLSCICNACGC